MRAASGVTAAGLTSALPLRGNVWGAYAVPAGQSPVPGEEPGIAFAFVLGRLISSLLFSVTPSDPATLSSVAAVTLGAAFLASWIPARRAARTSPMTALRYE